MSLQKKIPRLLDVQTKLVGADQQLKNICQITGPFAHAQLNL
jgi:hypothetical protein